MPSSFLRRHRWSIVVLAILAVAVVARGVLFETFTVPSGSMRPTLRPGDRIVVWKIGEDSLHRGDVIVFDASDAFDLDDGQGSDNAVVHALRTVGNTVGIRTGQTDYVKRVIGLPGDTVSVDREGVLRINGKVRRIAPLRRHQKAGDVPFTVTVPPGRLFVMGDDRAHSDDSRDHLGDPGGGTVPRDDVIGTVVLRYWPTGSWGRLPS